MREVSHFQAASAFSKRKIIPIVIRMQLRLHLLVCKIGHSIHMGNKAQSCPVFVSRCGRNGTIYIAFIIYMGIFDSHFFHFIHQHMSQIKLTLCGGHGSAGLTAGSGNTDVLQ